jgi:hypothetical protein
VNSNFFNTSICIITVWNGWFILKINHFFFTFSSQSISLNNVLYYLISLINAMITLQLLLLSSFKKIIITKNNSKELKNYTMNYISKTKKVKRKLCESIELTIMINYHVSSAFSHKDIYLAQHFIRKSDFTYESMVTPTTHTYYFTHHVFILIITKPLYCHS